MLSASLIRPVVARLRPANLDNPLSAMVHVVDGYRGGAYGFPSSHAANTAGLTFFVIQVFRKRAMLWLMVGWMLLVCYSRMYLGVHFLGDILVGIIIGAVIGTLMARVFLATSSKFLVTGNEIENGQADVAGPARVMSLLATPFSWVVAAFLLTILALLLYAWVRLSQGA